MIEAMCTTLGESLQQQNMRLVRVEDFQPAEALADHERNGFVGRFSILFLDDNSLQHGGVGQILKATTPLGEVLAVKQMLPPDASAETPAAQRAAAASAQDQFEQEYQVSKALSVLRSVPRVYGRGVINGTPCMIMEWIEGITLTEAARVMAVDDEGRISPLVAARIGRDLFDILTSMSYVADGFAHRDLSLRNIMVDTSRQSLAEQVEEGRFELRLIDFGSAVALGSAADATATSPTTSAKKHYGATPAFASPEMLAGVFAMEEARVSSAVDVYAAGSILHALLEGRPPFDVNDGEEVPDAAAAYQVKTQFAPGELTGAHGAAVDVAAVLAHEPEVAVAVAMASASLDGMPSANRLRLALSKIDDGLLPLVHATLQVASEKRPSAAQIRDALQLFCDTYHDNISRALHGEPLISCAFGEDARRTFKRKRRTRKVIRVALNAASWAICVSVAVLTGLLTHGMDVSFPFGMGLYEGAIPGAVVGAALLIPAVVGMLAQRRARFRFDKGLLQAIIGMLISDVVVCVGIGACTWPEDVVQTLFAAVFLISAAACIGYVANCAFVQPYASPQLGAPVNPQQQEALLLSAAVYELPEE